MRNGGVSYGTPKRTKSRNDNFMEKPPTIPFLEAKFKWPRCHTTVAVHKIFLKYRLAHIWLLCFWLLFSVFCFCGFSATFKNNPYVALIYLTPTVALLGMSWLLGFAYFKLYRSISGLETLELKIRADELGMTIEKSGSSETLAWNQFQMVLKIPNILIFRSRSKNKIQLFPLPVAEIGAENCKLIEAMLRKNGVPICESR